jgi:asparaginyl-tRNA synthetase
MSTEQKFFKISLDSLAEHKGHQVQVRGWVSTARKQKNVAFVHVYDGSSIETTQVVAKPGIIPDILSTHMSVEIIGEVVDSRGSEQALEIRAKSLKILGDTKEHDSATYPMAKTDKTLEFLRGIPDIRIRSPTFRAIMTIRNCCAMALHEFYQSKKYQWVHTPLITSSDCEGAGEAFEVKASTDTKENTFFKIPAFLTVSGQIHLETYACSGLAKGVYTFGPTFRAEHSNTNRHLSEFWMVEPELIFCSFEDLLQNAEGAIQHCATKVLKECLQELKILEALGSEKTLGSEKLEKYDLSTRVSKISTTTPQRCTYSEAVGLLQGHFEVQWGDDLSSDMEKWLTKHFDNIVTVTNYPRSLKAFYMRDGEDTTDDISRGPTVECMDVLVPGVGELVGGSMREHRLGVLRGKMEERNMDMDLYDWYVNLRRYGSVEHGGYGIGFERLVQLMTGMKNIRDVIPFPRAYGSTLIQ